LHHSILRIYVAIAPPPPTQKVVWEVSSCTESAPKSTLPSTLREALRSTVDGSCCKRGSPGIALPWKPAQVSSFSILGDFEFWKQNPCPYCIMFFPRCHQMRSPDSTWIDSPKTVVRQVLSISGQVLGMA
jgi:hypothetical protein